MAEAGSIWNYLAHKDGCRADPDRDPYFGCQCGLTAALNRHDREVRLKVLQRTVATLTNLTLSQDEVVPYLEQEVKRNLPVTRSESVDERFPEHVKLQKISDQSQAIGEFLEFSGFVLAVESDRSDGWSELEPAHMPITQILAEYFNIDQAKIETEKRQMLDELRASNATTNKEAGPA